MSDSLFVPAAGGTWMPTELSRGPWSPDALHGGPVAALLCGAAEPLLGGLQPARVTVELLRPVPLAPLTLSGEVSRPGKKVMLVATSLAAGDTKVATATFLGIRSEPVDAPLQYNQELSVPARPSEQRTAAFALPYTAFHSHAVEHCFVRGAFDQPGPATDWIRLSTRVVPDGDPTPLQRVMAAADFGNGVSRVISFEDLLFINPDLTVYLHRLPHGEWVCLDAATHMTAHGVALAESRLFDDQGPIGRSLQSLIVDAPARDQAPR